MQIKQTRLLALLPLIICIVVGAEPNQERLGSTRSNTNFEAVGTGRTFTSDPELHHVDRRTLLQERPIDADMMPKGTTSKEGKTVVRKLRRIGAEKKTRRDSERHSTGKLGRSEDDSSRNLGGCQNMKIELKIDKYGKETSVYLKNKSTGKAVMSSVKEVGAYQTKVLEACVSPGTYTLVLQDIDGLCCKNGKGSYKLSADGTVLVEGGFFIQSKSHTIKVGYDWNSEMNAREKEWLVAHNSRRQKYHRNAGKSYRPLRWSSTLASDALKWANSLLSACSVKGINHQGGVNDGENLAKNMGSGNWGSLYDADKIVGRWVENEANLAYPKNAHLTQVVWYSTSYVGCGESSKSMGNSKTCRVQVCRYTRPGNCNVKNGQWKLEAFKDSTGCGEECPKEGCYA